MIVAKRFAGRFRWALPCYLAAAPFEAIVTLSALQIMSSQPENTLFIQLGRAHPVPMAIFALLSVICALVAWRLDRPYRARLAAPRALPFRRVALDPTTAATRAAPDNGLEEPTLILNAVAVPAESAPPETDDALTTD